MSSETESTPSTTETLKGKIYLTEERCKGCSYCVVFCSSGALAMGGRLNQKGYHLPEVTDPLKCTGCGRCGLFCPDFAIFGVRLKQSKKREEES
jgi:2-oxoglutarate ferredoxin oxidoreductase subunit delta